MMVNPPDTTVTFEGFGKIPRLSRECVVTENIDGTNAQIYISKDAPCEHLHPIEGDFGMWLYPGSRNRFISTHADNFGFASWVSENAKELSKLGPGRHFGEWWGSGIQRGYGLKEKRFSLFNTHSWSDNDKRPACCGVVPIIWKGEFSASRIERMVSDLESAGSFAAPGFMNPEGVIVFHTASSSYFKKTITGDEKPKSLG
jgi:hypothetical protein